MSRISVDLTITEDSDDAWEDEYNGRVLLSDVDRVCSNTSVGGREWTGLRFVRCLPQQGSSIIAAYLRVYVASTLFDDANLDIYAQAAEDPPTFRAGDNYDVSSRPRTDAYVPWAADAIGNGWRRCPSLVPIVEELVAVCSPTAMVFVLKPRSDANKKLYLLDSHLSSMIAPVLHLEWE